MVTTSTPSEWPVPALRCSLNILNRLLAMSASGPDGQPDPLLEPSLKGTRLIAWANGVPQSRTSPPTVPPRVTTLIILHILFQRPSTSEFFPPTSVASLWEHFTSTPKFEFLDLQRRCFFKNVVLSFPASWFMSIVVAVLRCCFSPL